MTLETYDSADELILEEVPGLFEAIFDLLDKLNPAIARVSLGDDDDDDGDNDDDGGIR